MCHFLIYVQSLNDLGIGVIASPLYSILVASELVGSPNCDVFLAFYIIFYTTVGFSVVILSAMNLERYASIVHPVYHRNKVTKRKLLIYVFSFSALFLCVSLASLVLSENILSKFSGYVFLLHFVSTVWLYTRIFLVGKAQLKRSEPRLNAPQGNAQNRANDIPMQRENHHGNRSDNQGNSLDNQGNTSNTQGELSDNQDELQGEQSDKQSSPTGDQGHSSDNQEKPSDNQHNHSDNQDEREGQQSYNQGEQSDKQSNPTGDQGHSSDNQEKPSDNQGKSSNTRGRPSDNQGRQSCNPDGGLNNQGRPSDNQDRPSNNQSNRSDIQAESSQRNKLANQQSNLNGIRKPSSQASSNNRRSEQELLMKFKLAKSCLVVVVCSFIAFLLPPVFQPLELNKFDEIILDGWFTILVLLNSTLDSLIFFWKNNMLRSEAKKVFKSILS
ncbi:translation initiation factor IF-2 [Paramuricea clavata]|uniref:Translation initiation factor IF-2 n=1 Tax=Paramuricea clavata TaxID=317549 RepID=A0A7D9HCT1_PARCT|nr:translation initiation factor IF-2 [Paramuricea clavata]